MEAKKIPCSTCEAEFIPRLRRKRCDPCRYKHERKTSQCPYCEGIYSTHSGDTRPETAERMNHITKKCLKGQSE